VGLFTGNSIWGGLEGGGQINQTRFDGDILLVDIEP